MARRSTSRSGARGFASLWHLGWALTVAVAAGGLFAAGRLGVGPELAALGEGAGAALLGALLALMGGPGAAIAIVVWAFAAAAATLMTGGTAGPLAVWCLAPLAAATAFRKPSLLALGAAASVGAGAVATLGTILMPWPAVAPGLAQWMSLVALVTTAVGFATGVLALLGSVRRELRSREGAAVGLSGLVQHQPYLILKVTHDGRIIHTAGASLSGANDSRSLEELAAPSDHDALRTTLAKAAAQGSASVFVTPASDPEGLFEVTLTRMPRGGFAGAVRDARAQRDRERALEHERAAAEQQSAGKSRFLANMSHELRTPLNAVMGFSDIMRQRLFGPMGDRYGEYADLIHESGTHLLELINDVLDMSKIEAERFELYREQFDARESVQAVLRLMRGQADRAGVNLRAVLPVEALKADADRRALKQIAINLVSNALKFTPKGGSITVTCQGSGEILELIVADTGVGISPADLERLGAPYEQAGNADNRAGGTGLGLSLVRAFAVLHGGEMIMESAVGQGTTVTVRMPVLIPSQPPRFGREANAH